MTDEERQKLCAFIVDLRALEHDDKKTIEDIRHDYVKSMLETAADLIEQLAHELVATNERLVQLEARLEALERM